LEVETVSQTVSPSSAKTYGVARVVSVWGLARSSFYAARHRRKRQEPPRKRGPHRLSDSDLAEHIREVITQAVFVGEGYRKIWARLRHRGVRVWKERVLRVMRENQLLSPQRQPNRPTNPHDGTIVTERPNQIWGTDATSTITEREGQVTIFAAIDHCTAECVGIHVVKKAHRFEALEPIRQGVRDQFGDFSGGIAAGLWLRHDHGSVYMSDDFQKEIRFLGMESSPSFVRQPEGNGCIERFFRTVKEQLLWIRRFRDIDELRVALSEFRDRYNRSWILEKLGYRTPLQARRDFALEVSTAA
jgi:transposase InsO family protein